MTVIYFLIFTFLLSFSVLVVSAIVDMSSGNDNIKDAAQSVGFIAYRVTLGSVGALVFIASISVLLNLVR